MGGCGDHTLGKCFHLELWVRLGVGSSNRSDYLYCVNYRFANSCPFSCVLDP